MIASVMLRDVLLSEGLLLVVAVVVLVVLAVVVLVVLVVVVLVVLVVVVLSFEHLLPSF
jgi:hypothetical protein